jgi:hypothetical protein
VADGGLYIYGIVSRAASVDLESITHGELAAVVKWVSGEGLPDDIGLLETQLRAHEETLERLLDNTTVLPMRFGTVAPSRSDVAILLDRHHDQFASALRRLEGKVEWGLNVTWDPQAARSHIEANSPTLVHSGRRDGPGTTYLRSQRMKKSVGEQVEQTRLQLASTILDAMVDLSVEATVHPLRDQQDGLLTASFLVPRTDEDAFRSGVAHQLDLLDNGGAFGLAAEVSGPWPPYNFVGPMS